MMEYNFKTDSTEEKKTSAAKSFCNRQGTGFNQKPTPAFIGASWVALMAGVICYCTGLWNANMQLNEKGYYFTVLLFGLFSAVSVQKSVRDRLEGLQVSDMYYGLSWISVLTAILLLIIGLWNADLWLSEKGFYAMSYTLSLFAAIAVQKNTRDKSFIENEERILEKKEE
jgi:uncharacterized membrane protein YiaA